MTRRRSRLGRVIALAAMTLLVAGCGASTEDLMQPDSGGEGSVSFGTRNSFGQPTPLLTNGERRIFELGDSFFTQNWVTAPASTEARDGLGPLLNAQACASCHVRDGRAEPPGDEGKEPGLLLRISAPGVDGGPPGPDPVYGDQIQDRAILGVEPEGRIEITHEEVGGTYADGTPYSLSGPRYAVADLAYGPTADGLLLSPRIAPPVIGAGLIEAIPTDAILAGADPEDSDDDGISGRPNLVPDGSGGSVPGRFGWKANVATVRDQVLGALLEDIGITSDLHPENNCPSPATACQEAPDGGSPELAPNIEEAMVFYSQTLAVPTRRNMDDPAVADGAALFADLACTSCHTPMFTTADHEVTSVADQEIHPFSDFLLHDMGEGLADGRPDHEAGGSEWRTPPLWGIGLTEVVSGHTTFLHDGRARSLEEAILWHGGEAAAAKDRFIELSADDRSAIIAFLESL